MRKIAIISSSVREGRLSHRVALFLKDFIARRTGAQTEVLDLKEYDFPLFTERLANMPSPAAGVQDYARRFREADGIMVISPVYNGSFPAALKNAVDLLTTEWVRKPVCVASVTYGTVPGITTVQSLDTILMKMGARVACPLYTVIKAGDDFSPEGIAADPATAERFAGPAVDELMWLIEKGAEG